MASHYLEHKNKKDAQATALQPCRDVWKRQFSPSSFPTKKKEKNYSSGIPRIDSPLSSRPVASLTFHAKPAATLERSTSFTWRRRFYTVCQGRQSRLQASWSEWEASLSEAPGAGRICHLEESAITTEIRQLHLVWPNVFVPLCSFRTSA